MNEQINAFECLFNDTKENVKGSIFLNTIDYTIFYSIYIYIYI